MSFEATYPLKCLTYCNYWYSVNLEVFGWVIRNSSFFLTFYGNLTPRLMVTLAFFPPGLWLRLQIHTAPSLAQNQTWGCQPAQSTEWVPLWGTALLSVCLPFLSERRFWIRSLLSHSCCVTVHSRILLKGVLWILLQFCKAQFNTVFSLCAW